MPPLATKLRDDRAIDLVREWISEMRERQP
jgi:hypothetical protein